MATDAAYQDDIWELSLVILPVFLSKLDINSDTSAIAGASASALGAAEEFIRQWDGRFGTSAAARKKKREEIE